LLNLRRWSRFRIDPAYLSGCEQQEADPQIRVFEYQSNPCN
jgi:hypothetical protein